MIKLHEHYSTKVTPQSEPIPNTTQVENNAGGYVWAIDKWKLLDRFLILGCEGGSYYVREKKLTRDAAKDVEACIREDGQRVVSIIVNVSSAGRSSKNDPALFALAMCSSLGDERTRKAAYAALPRVARIGTHLFHFAEYRQAFGGWGRGMRKAVASWYESKTPDSLAYQLVKYQQRDGWSHKDLLRLSHPFIDNPEWNAAIAWSTGYKGGVIKGRERSELGSGYLPKIIHGFEKIQGVTTPKLAVDIIADYRLPRECVPTELLKSPRVWEALLNNGMGMTALIRNLGNMSKCNLLVPMSDAEKFIVSQLSDVEIIAESKIHPIQVLTAMMTYSSGSSNLGHGKWEPCQKVVDALNDAFYSSFNNVEPTGKNILLALDVSGSMNGGNVGGVNGLTPRMASSAMAMVTARTEKNYHIMAFSSGFIPINISPKMRLDDIVAKTDMLDFDGTDCALPMQWAMEKKINVDAFVIYTDNETWGGGQHPSQALVKYRRKLNNPEAKLIVVGMVLNEFTIADPKDAGMLDVVGFDPAVPQVMSNFIRG